MAGEFSVEVPTPAEWLEPGKQVTRAMERAVALTADEAWGQVRDGAPVDEGRLAGSWEIKQTGELSWLIFTEVIYARAVSEGTAPHVIEPRNGRALAFQVAGQTVIVRRVNHPGTAANPYVENALKAAEGRASEFMRRALAEAA